MHLLDLFSILVAGLMIGTELTVSLFIHPVMHQLDTPAQTRGLSLFAAVLGRAMPFWYALCLLLFLAETYVHRADAAFPFLLTASLLWAAVIVFTILFLVPINKRIAALSADAPLEQWFPAHQRWEASIACAPFCFWSRWCWSFTRFFHGEPEGKAGRHDMLDSTWIQ